MAHLHRFYHIDALDPSGDAILSREESHHATRVLRARVGDAVALFNGQGTEWRGAISALSRNVVSVAIESEAHCARPAPEVTLAQAWLHRDKSLDEIVRQCTVLGAAEIAFFRADHSEKKPHIPDKWERLCIEACKQCGRLWLPRLTVADNLATVLETRPKHRAVLARMEGPHVPIAEAASDTPVLYIVGPEGDFSEAELQQAEAAGAMPVSLGDYTYRAEMAAMVGLTLIQHHLGHVGLR